MTRPREIRMRDKSHWCLESKHVKCGGKVSSLKHSEDTIHQTLRRINFRSTLCECRCHGERIN